MTEQELEGLKHVLGHDEVEEAEETHEEAKTEKKKKRWGFNPIRTLIINPVGTVLRVPGKIVGAVVGSSNKSSTK